MEVRLAAPGPARESSSVPRSDSRMTPCQGRTASRRELPLDGLPAASRKRDPQRIFA